MFAHAREAVEPRESQVFVHTWPCPSKPAALDESKSRSGPHVPGDAHAGNRTSAVDGGGTRHRCPAHSTSRYQNRNNSNDQPGRRRPGPGCPKGCETGCFLRFSCHGQGRSPTPTQPLLPGRKRRPTAPVESPTRGPGTDSEDTLPDWRTCRPCSPWNHRPT